MIKLTVWFKNLKPSHQVTISTSIIAGIFAIIVATINVLGNRTKLQNEFAVHPPVQQEENNQQKNIQHPEVKRVNTDVFEYLKQIDTKTDVDERQRLLNIVFDHLEKSEKIDPTDGETCFLFGEAYLRNKNYTDAIYHYDTSLSKKYFNNNDVYLGYSNAYEALGDQYISNNDFPSAVVYYKHAIIFLNNIINDTNLPYQDNNKTKNILSRIEFKKGNYEYAEEYFNAFESISKDSNNNNNITAMMELAAGYAEKNLWKNAVCCYYWLFKQNTSKQRQLRIMHDFQYYSDFWEFSSDFDRDISINSVNAIINNEQVKFRKEPIIDNNTIREFQLYEDVQVLQRSNFKQTIGNVNTYWYKICTKDNIEGWVYGKYLCFYPDFSL